MGEERREEGAQAPPSEQGDRKTGARGRARTSCVAIGVVW